MHNGRPLSQRKKVQLMLALTILAWATQTLFAQWSHGAETTVFVPRESSPASGTLELRGEARVTGAEVRLRQVCRWSESDALMFAPVADVVLAKFDAKRPQKSINVRDVRQVLEDAGINLAIVRFSGPVQCTAIRADQPLDEAESLKDWANSRTKAPAVAESIPATAPVKAAVATTLPATRASAAAAIDRTVDTASRTLRDTLADDLAVRLSLPAELLVLEFDPKDEAALRLSEPQFTFGIQAKNVRNLGDVSWDVTIGSAAGSKKVSLRGTARAWENQLVVARPLGRQQVIQNSDFTARRTMVERLPDAPLLTAEQVTGQLASRDLKPGTIFTAPLVEAVQLAKLGQFISVTLDRGTVRIKSVAKAMESGCYGQTIRVKNEATHDVYEVMLTGPQEATMASPTRVSNTVASADGVAQ